MLSLGKRNRRERNKTPDLPRGGEVAEFTRKTFEIPVKQLPREQPHNKGNNCQAGGKHRGRIWSAFGIGEIGATAQVTWLGAASGAVTGKCGVTAPALPPRVYLPEPGSAPTQDLQPCRETEKQGFPAALPPPGSWPCRCWGCTCLVCSRFAPRQGRERAKQVPASRLTKNNVKLRL